MDKRLIHSQKKINRKEKEKHSLNTPHKCRTHLVLGDVKLGWQTVPSPAPCNEVAERLVDDPYGRYAFHSDAHHGCHILTQVFWWGSICCSHCTFIVVNMCIISYHWYQGCHLWSAVWINQSEFGAILNFQTDIRSNLTDEVLSFNSKMYLLHHLCQGPIISVGCNALWIVATDIGKHFLFYDYNYHYFFMPLIVKLLTSTFQEEYGGLGIIAYQNKVYSVYHNCSSLF